jgi:hypothetical protein
MATTTLGGKPRRSPAAGTFVKPREPFLEEAFAPLADDLARGVEPRGDLVVAQPLGGVEDDLRAKDVSIR